MLGWSTRRLAFMSGLSHSTIARIEAGGETLASNLVRIQKALEDAGVVFGADGSVRLARLTDEEELRAMKVRDEQLAEERYQNWKGSKKGEPAKG